jgi:hypothetical protein
LVYETDTEGDGCFEAHERDEHMQTALIVISKWLIDKAVVE